MTGMTFEDMNQNRLEHAASSLGPIPIFRFQNRICPRGNNRESLLRPLADPLLQDLSHTSKKYLSYCKTPFRYFQCSFLTDICVSVAGEVCRDLVAYDIPNHNPFYDLIPMTRQHEVLLQVIIAGSAVHMSNASQKLSVSDTTTPPISSAMPQPKEYRDALVAKQRALYLLNSALDDILSADLDVLLAVVLLFIELELIESGRDKWKWHISGARTIINRLGISTRTPMSLLRRFLISNCLVYVCFLNLINVLMTLTPVAPRFDIFGSTLACSSGHKVNALDSTGALSLLKDEEGNNCPLCPAVLLEIIQGGAQLSRSDPEALTEDWDPDDGAERAHILLQDARSFDALAWATASQRQSPYNDVEPRTHLASAYRSAVCIYLSRILLSISPAAEPERDSEALVSEVIHHLSFIQPGNSLLKATTWPTFIAGAETKDPERQAWVVARLREIWEVEPWGHIRGTLGALELIWHRRKTAAQGGASVVDWIEDLRTMGVDWLIV